MYFLKNIKQLSSLNNIYIYIYIYNRINYIGSFNYRYINNNKIITIKVFKHRKYINKNKYERLGYMIIDEINHNRIFINKR